MESEEAAKVIVIGAGAAGLAAADELCKAGIAPLILEARERVGGRIYTLRDDKTNAPVELGAEFVHGTPAETFDLASEAGLEIVKSEGATWQVREDGKLELYRESSEENDLWEKLEKYAEMKDISLRDFLNQSGSEYSARESIERYVEGFHAAQVEKISVKSLLKTERAAERIKGEKAFRVKSGYDSLTDYLCSQSEKRGARFLLGRTVKTIKWQKGAVEIKCVTDKGEEIFTASRIIVTLPLGVLQAKQDEAGAVKFEPELDSKKAALSQMEMGAARRILLLFKQKWWNEILSKVSVEKTRQKPGFLSSLNEPIPTWWTNEPLNAPLLTGWVGGRQAAEISERDADFVITQAVESLMKIFGVERRFIENELNAAHSYNWQNDEFSRGSYSYILVGGIDAPRVLAAPVENTLFFAGEATNSDGHWGTVHGALTTGRRAAREILDGL